MPGYIFNTNNECIDMSLFTTSADASTLAKHYVGCKVVH